MTTFGDSEYGQPVDSDAVEALLQLPPDLVPGPGVFGEVGLRVHQLLLQLLVWVVTHHFVDDHHKVAVGRGVAELSTWSGIKLCHKVPLNNFSRRIQPFHV